MKIVFLLFFFACFIINTAFADDVLELKEQVKALTQAVHDLKNTVESQQGEINSLKESQNIKPEISIAQPISQPSAPTPILPRKFTPEIGAVEESNVELEEAYLTRFGLPFDSTPRI